MDAQGRILIVEDEPGLADVTRQQLEQAGYEAEVVLSGEEAITLVRSKEPDLVLLDLMLPNMDGYDVCSVLKQDIRTQRIPVLVVTMKFHEKDRRRAEECGADAFVSRPWKTDALLAKIQMLLHDGRNGHAI